MAAKIITVTDMSRSFADVINKVRYKGETYEIKKGVNIVARLCPLKENKAFTIKDLSTFIENLPKLSKEELDEMERVIKETRQTKLTKEDFPKWE